MKSDTKGLKKIVFLITLLFMIGGLPLGLILGLKAFSGLMMASAPSEQGLRNISRMSRAGLAILRVYPQGMFKDTAKFFELSEDKYLSNLLAYSLRQQIETTVLQGIGGAGDTRAMITAMENQANNLLKQMNPSEDRRSLVAFGRELLPLARWAMGFDRKKTFLILLQNSTEQRPQGGLIEGVGTAVFEKGKILDISWLKPDDIQASLTGSEDAPFPIRSMLGEEKLLFRDANWPIDGPAAALQLKKMYERATGRGVDGAVFLSTAGVDDILAALGKEKIKEKSAFSGPEFIIQTAETLSGEVKTFPFLTIKGLLAGLQNENILMIPFEQEQARMASNLGIDGKVGSLPCPSQLRSAQCFSDSIFVVDANLGANKADYFLKKNRRTSTVLDPVKPPETVLDLSYANTSTVSNSSSSYRGYVRIAVPLQSVIKSVVSIENGQSAQIPTDNYVEFGKHIIGFGLEVKPGEAKVFRINYVSTANIPTDRGVGGYVINFKKQPGGSVPTESEIKLPEGMTPLAVYPAAEAAGNSLHFKLPMARSGSVAVEFAVNSLFR